MFRAALTYQLILAVAVGPLLCCCTFGKALAYAPAPHAAPQHGAARAPSDAAGHSCCAHKHTTPKPAADKKPAPAKPSAPGKCPCKDSGDKAQVAQAESTQTSLSAFLRTLTLETVFWFSPLSAPEGVADVALHDGGRSFSYTPSVTDQLLYAHHNLRC